MKAKPSMERRNSPRKKCFKAVAYATQTFSSIEYIQDISAWGVFIRTDKQVPVGEDITITIPQINGTNSMKIVGEVVRTTPDGVGVKFKMGIDDSVAAETIKE